MATDKEQLKEVALYGYGEIATSFMSKNGMYWYEDVEVPAYDPEGAKALLAEAGYGDGLELTLSLDSGNTVNATMGTLLKEQWAQVGVTLNLETLEKGTINERMSNMTLTMQLRGWTNDMADPSQQADYSCVYANAKCLFTGWQNAEVEDLVAQAKVELDPEKRQELYYQIQQIFADDMPMISLFYIPYPVAYRSNVQNFIQTPLGAYRFATTTK
jgi:peptide/nickel transport system substrate-binding protein